MRFVHHGGLTLLLTAAVAHGQGTPLVVKAWGPSWAASTGKRPLKLGSDIVHSHVFPGTDKGVPVAFWADVAGLKPGHQYRLMYQYRLHTKKGELGEVLATADQANGARFPLATAMADGTWNGLEGKFEVTVNALSAVTNWPAAPGANRTVFVYVEPQVRDSTADKFLTPDRTSGIVTVVVLGEKGEVRSVRSLGDWLEAARTDADIEDRLARLADLEGYNATDNGLGESIGKRLIEPAISAKAKARLIAFVPAEILGLKDNAALLQSLQGFAKGADAEVKDVAAKKLREFRP